LYLTMISLRTLNDSGLLHFFFNNTSATKIYTLSLHDALPIYLKESAQKSKREDELWIRKWRLKHARSSVGRQESRRSHSHYCARSEEHTSELQSRSDLVCRLLLEKKN